jgi:hypothetical protein
MLNKHGFNLSVEERQDQRRDRLLRENHWLGERNLSSFKLRSSKRRSVQKIHNINISPEIYSAVSQIPNCLNKLKDSGERFGVLDYFCELVKKGSDFVLNNLMKQDVVPVLLQCIECENNPSVQHRALWLIIQIGVFVIFTLFLFYLYFFFLIASGKTKNVRTIAHSGLISLLFKLLFSKNQGTRELVY